MAWCGCSATAIALPEWLIFSADSCDHYYFTVNVHAYVITFIVVCIAYFCIAYFHCVLLLSFATNSCVSVFTAAIVKITSRPSDCCMDVVVWTKTVVGNERILVRIGTEMDNIWVAGRQPVDVQKLGARRTESAHQMRPLHAERIQGQAVQLEVLLHLQETRW